MSIFMKHLQIFIQMNVNHSLTTSLYRDSTGFLLLLLIGNKIDLVTHRNIDSIRVEQFANVLEKYYRKQSLQISSKKNISKINEKIIQYSKDILFL
ncbi:unnamed protein product [Rotaria sordida]|uniref:Uncharacterized protein n=1 Tax=Rotaria sordida TaxID=392033 RepID=A0A815RHH3_9BILA|nr:unnamed protein product [Rotaria sordida]CAF1476477.1 unnamed protein product [Rotaria sordida]CAF1477396.1 unnamed protein product [Rotaria sordida]